MKNKNVQLIAGFNLYIYLKKKSKQIIQIKTAIGINTMVKRLLYVFLQNMLLSRCNKVEM